MSDYSSRLFIDLILKGSSRWASWSPSKAIQIGDFGKINRTTGEFESCGSIYTHPDIITAVPALSKSDCKATPPTEHDVEDLYWVTSDSFAGHKIQTDGEAQIPGIVEASVKFEFTDNKTKRGAFLVMQKLRTATAPTTIPMKELAKVAILKGMFVVTEVVTCPSYAMGIVASDERSVSVTLAGNVPVSSAIVGGVAHAEWHATAAAKAFRQSRDLNGDPRFAVLYQLRKLSRPWKDYFFGSYLRGRLPPKPDDDAIWVDVKNESVPWKPLKEDGTEESDDEDSE